MGGGGGGGGPGYIPPTSEELRRKVEEAQAKERERLDADVNGLLGDLLAKVNQRDADALQDHLSELKDLLGSQAEIEQFLFGGSVAKHTYVDGLSDVDALVVLDRQDLEGRPPGEVLDAFFKTLNSGLTRDKVASVEKGRLAVTVTYVDGTEVQLLPALRTGTKVSISDATGSQWKETNPKKFQRALTKANVQMNNQLVPVIKLAKAIVAGFPEQKQLKGYHMECLALDAATNYNGPKTLKSLLSHVLDHASTRVLRPIQDVTGQSRAVDSDLGPPNSAERRNISQALAGVKRRLDAATTLGQWKGVFLD